MRISRRTHIDTAPFFDVRFIEKILGGNYDNIYIILTTLEEEPTEAWEDQGDSFLMINLPKQKVMEASIDYKSEIVRHLPMLSWLQPEELRAYVDERWN